MDFSSRSSVDMDFSNRSTFDANTGQELTVQQIHDQRSKLAAKDPAESALQHQPTPAPPASHRLSSTSKKEPKSSNAAVVPGAFSVASSGGNVSVARSDESGNISVAGSDENESSVVVRDENPSSMVDTNTEMEAPVTMQLEAVPVDESLEQAKLNEMEEQMNNEIQRRLSLERKLADTEGNGGTKNNNSGHKASCIKERIPIVMAFLVILSGIAVGLYFLLAPNETQKNVESPYMISPPPSAPPSAPPIAAPVQFEYPPPTEEQCEAIINGNSVPGQEDYFSQLIDTLIDVSTHEPWEDSLDTVLLDVQNTWQTVIHPTYAGCMDTAETLLLNSTVVTRGRPSNEVTRDRYVIGNAVVLDVNQVPDGECKPEEPRPCVRVGIRGQIWLKKTMKFHDILSTIQKNYGKFLFGNRDHTTAIIKQVKMVGIYEVP